MGRAALWVGGPLAISAAIAGVLVLVAGDKESHACTPSPTSSACHLSTPLEAMGLVLLVVGVVGMLWALRAKRRRERSS